MLFLVLCVRRVWRLLDYSRGSRIAGRSYVDERLFQVLCLLGLTSVLLSLGLLVLSMPRPFAAAMVS